MDTPIDTMDTSRTDELTKTVIASTTGGFISRLCFHPFDTLKSRIQGLNVYGNTAEAFVGTLKETGLRGLYRGLGTALLGGIPGSAMYFTGYETCKVKLIEHQIPHLLAYSLSGLMAEAFSCLIYVPVDVIKERLQVYQHNNVIHNALHKHASSSSTVYTSSLDAILKILKREGSAGLYKGIHLFVFAYFLHSILIIF